VPEAAYKAVEACLLVQSRARAGVSLYLDRLQTAAADDVVVVRLAWGATSNGTPYKITSQVIRGGSVAHENKGIYLIKRREDFLVLPEEKANLELKGSSSLLRQIRRKSPKDSVEITLDIENGDSVYVNILPLVIPPKPKPFLTSYTYHAKDMKIAGEQTQYQVAEHVEGFVRTVSGFRPGAEVRIRFAGGPHQQAV
jgi:hypothetical protein